MKRFAGAKSLPTIGSTFYAYHSQSRASTTQSSAVRAPWFVMVGGGMAAGKTSAAVAQALWLRTQLSRDAVVIDPDEFKKKHGGVVSTDKKAHKESVRTAEEVLLAALNEGKDIILEGTMSWLPYVAQTIDMVRDAHRHTYKRSNVGFLPGIGVEEYWARDGQKPSADLSTPYCVKVAGVTVDPLLAVERAHARSKHTGRSVPMEAQLRSLRLFSQAFDQYCLLADSAILYDNNAHQHHRSHENLELPVIAEKTDGGALRIKDPSAFRDFLRHSHINHHATGEFDLWQGHSERPDWEVNSPNQQCVSEVKT